VSTPTATQRDNAFLGEATPIAETDVVLPTSTSVASPSVIPFPTTHPTILPTTTPTPLPLFVVWSPTAETVYLRELPNGRVQTKIDNGSLARDTGPRLQNAGLTWSRVCVLSEAAYSVISTCGWVADDFLYPWRDGQYSQVQADLGANLRAAPDGSILIWLPDGTPVLPTGRYDGDWREVRLLNDVAGWVYGTLLQDSPALTTGSPLPGNAAVLDETPIPVHSGRRPLQSVLPYTETITHTLYLPFIAKSPSRLDITQDFRAQSLTAICDVYTTPDAFSWNDVYTCNTYLRSLFVPTERMIVSRKLMDSMGQYISGMDTRIFVEYPVPSDIALDKVLGIEMCLSTQYWRPDKVYLQVGTWTPGAVWEIATSPDLDKNVYADKFFGDIWQNYGSVLYTIPPLPRYTPYDPCTPTFIPVSPDTDGVLRFVMRTADDQQPPTYGAFGFGNYYHDFDTHQEYLSTVYLVYER